MIITTDHGPVRELKLNRPPANALSPALIVALRDAITTAPNGGARALVLSGIPGMFSGGLDVPQWLTLDRPALAQAWRDFLFAVARACLFTHSGRSGDQWTRSRWRHSARAFL